MSKQPQKRNFIIRRCVVIIVTRPKLIIYNTHTPNKSVTDVTIVIKTLNNNMLGFNP